MQLRQKKYKDDDDGLENTDELSVSSVSSQVSCWLQPNGSVSQIHKCNLIAFAVWGILRCILLLVSIVRGKITQKGRILSP
jgi:hypothetical protein